MKFAHFITRSKAILQKEGFVFLIRNIYLKLINLLFDYRCYFIFEQTLENCVRINLSLPSGNRELRIITSNNELDDLIKNNYDFTYLDDIEKIRIGLKSGAILFALFINKELAHTSWAALSGSQSIFDWIFQKLHYSDAGFIGPCDTLDKYRGLGLYPYTLTHILVYFMESGKDRALINCRITNSSSIKGILKAGFHYRSKARYIKCASFESFKEIML